MGDLPESSSDYCSLILSQKESLIQMLEQCSFRWKIQENTVIPGPITRMLDYKVHLSTLKQTDNIQLEYLFKRESGLFKYLQLKDLNNPLNLDLLCADMTVLLSILNSNLYSADCNCYLEISDEELYEIIENRQQFSEHPFAIETVFLTTMTDEKIRERAVNYSKSLLYIVEKYYQLNYLRNRKDGSDIIFAMFNQTYTPIEAEKIFRRRIETKELDLNNSVVKNYLHLIEKRILV